MKSLPAHVLPSIRTLPLTGDAPELFSRAVRLARQAAHATIIEPWLNERYAEAAMRMRCQKTYHKKRAQRLRQVQHDSPAYRRRLAIKEGRPLDELKRERIEEARFRGQRLKGAQLVTRGYPEAHPDEKLIDETNVDVVWAWEDEQYCRRLREIRAERRSTELDEGDRPDNPVWRLRRAVDEIVATRYPLDPAEHVEFSRQVVAIAALLMPERLPMLGGFGAMRFASVVAAEGDGEDAVEAAGSSEQLHGYHPTVLDDRVEGREEAMFVQFPGEDLEVRPEFPLDGFLERLRVAVDELEALPVGAMIDTPGQKDDPPPAKQQLAGQGKPVKGPAMTRQDAARKLGIHEGTVSRWLDDGTLKGRMVNKRWEINPDSVEQAVERAAAEKRAAAGESAWKCTGCKATTYSVTRPPDCDCGHGVWYTPRLR